MIDTYWHLVKLAVSFIQLPYKKGTRYGFSVPNCYIKTKLMFKHDKKYFSD